MAVTACNTLPHSPFTLVYAYIEPSLIRNGRCGVFRVDRTEPALADPPPNLDAALVNAAQHDRAAFGALYERYADPVYRYCFRRLGAKEAAEDATAQVFANILRALPDYRETGRSFRSWLFAIAHNVLIDAERAWRPQQRMGDDMTVPDPAPGPEAEVLAAETRQEVLVLLEALPPDQRRVIELRLAGLATAEIADALGSSPGAIRTSQCRAVKRLRLVLNCDSWETGGRDD